jgi:hypothetical protein
VHTQVVQYLTKHYSSELSVKLLKPQFYLKSSKSGDGEPRINVQCFEDKCDFRMFFDKLDNGYRLVTPGKNRAAHRNHGGSKRKEIDLETCKLNLEACDSSAKQYFSRLMKGLDDTT